MFDRETFAILMRRARQGDEMAAADLVEKYEPLIRREVRIRLDDPRLRRVLDSMDVCQSVLASFFVRTAMGEYDLDDPNQLVALLVSMTRNKVASAARQETRMKRDVRRLQNDACGITAVAQDSPHPSQVALTKDLLEHVRAQLSPEERQIAELRGQGASWSSIAEEIGGTSDSKRIQFSRALERVRHDLGIDSNFDD